MSPGLQAIETWTRYDSTCWEPRASQCRVGLEFIDPENSSRHRPILFRRDTSGFVLDEEQNTAENQAWIRATGSVEDWEHIVTLANTILVRCNPRPPPQFDHRPHSALTSLARYLVTGNLGGIANLDERYDLTSYEGSQFRSGLESLLADSFGLQPEWRGRAQRIIDLWQSRREASEREEREFAARRDREGSVFSTEARSGMIYRAFNLGAGPLFTNSSAPICFNVSTEWGFTHLRSGIGLNAFFNFQSATPIPETPVASDYYGSYLFYGFRPHYQFLFSGGSDSLRAGDIHEGQTAMGLQLGVPFGIRSPLEAGDHSQFFLGLSLGLNVNGLEPNAARAIGGGRNYGGAEISVLVTPFEEQTQIMGMLMFNFDMAAMIGGIARFFAVGSPG